MSQLPAPPPKSVRKACDACHAIKVRCVSSKPGTLASACQRCMRLEIQCKHSTRTPRRRKGTDSRVATLEKEIERLRTMSKSDNSSPELRPILRDDVEDNRPIKPFSSTEAEALLRVYANEYASVYPVVTVGSESYSSLYSRKPLLAQTLTSLVAAGQRPTLAYRLQDRILDQLTSSVSSPGLSYLDLVESALVMVHFLTPSNDFAMKSNRFHELVHLCLSSAGYLDVQNDALPDIMEQRRVYVGCFLISQGISMTMRSPSMVRWSEKLELCLGHLKNSNDSADLFIYRHGELFQIVEEINDTLRRPDCSVDIDDGFTMQRLQYFRNKLQAWHAAAGLFVLKDDTALLFHFVMTYLHEAVLYIEHQSTDFVAPFCFEQVGLTAASGRELSVNGASCLAQMLSSAHSFLDIFNSVPPSSLQYLQTGHFLRLLYIAFVMTKLAISPLDSRSSIGRHILAPQVKGERYLLAPQVKAGYYRGRTMDLIQASVAEFPSTRVQVFGDRLQNLSLYWTALACALRDGPTVGGDSAHCGSQTGGTLSSSSFQASSGNENIGQIAHPKIDSIFVSGTANPIFPQQTMPSNSTAPGQDTLRYDFWDPSSFHFLDPADIVGDDLNDFMTDHDVDWSLLMPQ